MMFSFYLLYDEYNRMNFLSSEIVSWLYDTGMMFFLMETLFGLCIYFTERFPSVIDIDIPTVSIFWLCIKTFRIQKKKILDSLFNVDLIRERDLLKVDRVCRMIYDYTQQ